MKTFFLHPALNQVKCFINRLNSLLNMRANHNDTKKSIEVLNIKCANVKIICCAHETSPEYSQQNLRKTFFPLLKLALQLNISPWLAIIQGNKQAIFGWVMTVFVCSLCGHTNTAAYKIQILLCFDLLIKVIKETCSYFCTLTNLKKDNIANGLVNIWINIPCVSF